MERCPTCGGKVKTHYGKMFLLGMAVGGFFLLTCLSAHWEFRSCITHAHSAAEIFECLYAQHTEGY